LKRSVALLIRFISSPFSHRVPLGGGVAPSRGVQESSGELSGQVRLNVSVTGEKVHFVPPIFFSTSRSQVLFNFPASYLLFPCDFCRTSESFDFRRCASPTPERFSRGGQTTELHASPSFRSCHLLFPPLLLSLDTLTIANGENLGPPMQLGFAPHVYHRFSCLCPLAPL